MALAGRCNCGVRLDLAAQDPEDHLSCHGDKRCGYCDNVRPESEFRRHRCRTCFRAYDAANKRRRFNTDLAYRQNKNYKTKLYRVYGPKTRRGKLPRQHHPTRTCRDCRNTYKLQEFLVRTGLQKRCRQCLKSARNKRQVELYWSNDAYREARKSATRRWKSRIKESKAA